MIELDHVILAVPDLEAAARRFEEAHRLPSVPGGRHEGLGTENRIVPLGEAYIELLGVADEAEARANPFGTWLLERVSDGEAWVGWAVRTDDLDTTCERLGLEATPMSRVRPDGSQLRWCVAGLQEARRDPSRPFFIQWDVPDAELPGRAGGETQAAGSRLAALRVGGDEDALCDWLGGELPGSVRMTGGASGVHSVAVAGAGGVEVVGPGGN